MTTPIQPVPDVILASEFPSLADRPAGTYNAKAKAWADSENAMATRTREIALTAKNNAEAAREAADEAVPAAATAVSARDKALEYKESAEATAAAVGVEAGLPSLVGNAGKALIVGPDEEAVGWYSAIPTIGVRQLDSAAAITAADQALMLRCDGAFTLSFDPVATLPSGWFCYIKNAGDGDITLDPSGSEQIDGLTSYIMYPGECRLIAHNGTEFVSVVLNGFYKVFESSGDFVKPPGYRLFEGLLWGGGASGAKSNNHTYVFGGGGAGCAPFLFPAEHLAAVESVVIAAGGAAQTANPSSGLAGGSSTFKGVQAFGGGAAAYQDGSPASARIASGGDSFLGWAGSAINTVFSGGAHPFQFGVPPNSVSGFIQPFYGGAGLSFDTSSQSEPTARTVFGGASGGYLINTTPTNASVSIFGGPPATPSATAGVDGNTPGGGGCPTRTGPASGAGGRGEMRIWGII